MTADSYINKCLELRSQLSGRVQEVQPKYNVKLPDLPESWRWVSLSEISERVSVGHVGPTTEHFCDKEDGVALARSQNVRPGSLELDSVAHITRKFHNKLKKSQLKGGDILIVRVGANRGDCCSVPLNVTELNCANIVFARLLIPSKFFSYYFQSDFGRDMLLSASTGAAQGVINTTAVARMPVPVPPEDEMEELSRVLETYDILIENNDRRIATLEEMAQSLYREWFVKFRFPGHEIIEFKASSLGQIPEGWEIKRLKDVLELAYGKALKKSDRRGGEVSVYGSGGLGGWHNSALVKGPNIIVGRKGNVGRVFWVEEDCWPIDTVFYVKSEFSKFYLYYNLLYQTFHNSDSAVPGLNRESAYSNKLIVPAYDVVERFEQFITPVFAQLKLLRRKCTNLKEQRDLLLPKLISGKIGL